ncbi:MULTISPECIES: ribonuclease domain-containing protein [unclassified Streptomyces]|uniref:ribonuclease domain-containing protein n=1 Tax=unclassified Streptomyces TaxID=2593676 RepID=UPI0033FA5039
MPTRSVRTTVAALLACLALLLAGCGGAGEKDAGPSRAATATAAATPGWARGMATVRVGGLPAEARRTLELVDRGGPFPYSKDGTVFGNAEKALPRHARGYYHEYTVTTPKSRDRGARRLVTGQGGEIYYTGDHYKTFLAVLR